MSPETIGLSCLMSFLSLFRGEASISQLPSSQPRFLPLSCGTPIEILQASSKSGVASASSKTTSLCGRMNPWRWMKVIQDQTVDFDKEFVSPNSHQPTPNFAYLREAVMVGVDVFELTYPMEAKLTKRCVERMWLCTASGSEWWHRLAVWLGNACRWIVWNQWNIIIYIYILYIWNSCGWLHSWVPF